jgi:hypothetical protein
MSASRRSGTSRLTCYLLAGLSLAGCATPSVGPAESEISLFAGGPRVGKRLATLRDLKTRDVVMQTISAAARRLSRPC